MDRKVLLMIFKLMCKKKLLTHEQLEALDNSMYGPTPDNFINVINEICEGD